MEVVVERARDYRAPREALWKVVANTELLNRAIGLGRLELSPNDDASAARYVVHTVSGGFPIEYRERPYEWVEAQWFSVLRVVHKGAVRTIEHSFRLEPTATGGTHLTVRTVVVPKTALLAPVVRLQVTRFMQRTLDQLSEVDDELVSKGAARLTLRPSSPAGGALERFGRELLTRVSREQRAAAEDLLYFVRHASDAEVERMRPFELADAWQRGRRDVLLACLHGVMTGLLELRWDLICPSCHTASERIASLEELESEAHCQLCDLSFGIELDRAVEATFRPTPAVRDVQGGPYCTGGPGATPHVVIQVIVAPMSVRSVTIPNQPGRYRLFARGGQSATLEIEQDAPRDGSVTIDHSAITPATLRLSPGASLLLDHQSERERHIKIERSEVSEHAATAQFLSTVPEFRRFFTRQLLRPGMALRVGRVALVFTDLKDSTRLYGEIGDGRAYRLVQDHFDALFAVVERCRGSVIKLMGDAIMAAFSDERDAMLCAAEMLRAYERLCDRNPDALRSGLKIGVHAGTCYGVTANGVFDYFGQHVNLAARLQAEAEAGQIVTTEALASETAVWLPGVELKERFTPSLKGIAGEVRAARLVLAREQVASDGSKTQARDATG